MIIIIIACIPWIAMLGYFVVTIWSLFAIDDCIGLKIFMFCAWPLCLIYMCISPWSLIWPEYGHFIYELFTSIPG